MRCVRLLSYCTIFFLFTAIGCNRSTPGRSGAAKSDDVAGSSSPVKPVRYEVPSLTGTHILKKICDTDSHLTINRITVTDTKTIIDMTFNNIQIGDEPARGRIRTAAPGQNTAFYIADPNKRGEYALLNVEGIALEPRWSQLREGDRVNFRLSFERIPDTLTTFHLIEGKTPSIDSNHELATTWTFMNIRLR